MGNFKEELTRVEAFVFDVDGVFTDGGIVPLADGDFLRSYYAKDGYAVAYAVREGYKIAIITGGRGKTLEKRFEMLHVTKLYANCGDKEMALREFAAEQGLDLRNVVYMGDDIPDINPMMQVGMPGCPELAFWTASIASARIALAIFVTGKEVFMVAQIIKMSTA